jgi:phospholipid-binding lipoprotein MlaA
MNRIVKLFGTWTIVLGAGLGAGACADRADTRAPSLAVQRAALDAAGPAALAQAAPAAPAAEDEEAHDPYETINRDIFAFNQALDHYFLRPVAWVYREGVPPFARDRFHDFLYNLKTPVILLNNLLKGQLARADITVRRFFINTTIGLGGLIDIAGSIGIPFRSDDFGQTLAVWGTGEGFYMVIPLFGPSNPRDAAGLLVDTLTDPFTYLTFSRNSVYGYARFGLTALDERSRTIDQTDDIERNSVDVYAAYRSLFRQHRQGEITGGETPAGLAYPGQDGGAEKDGK